MRFFFVLSVCIGGMLTVCPLGRADDVTESEKDTAIHVPTPHDVVARMLEVAEVNQNDLLYDLGCGDGRILVAAAKNCGCTAIGYDISPHKVIQSRENVAKHGLQKLVSVKEQDIFKLDLSKATVITLYLLPEMNDKLVPQLEKMADGIRVVTHDFAIEGIRPTEKHSVKSNETDTSHDVYLYTLPFKHSPRETP
jgi:ribosomal protein L11 methylase PrmA